MKPAPAWCSVHTHSVLCDGKSTPEAMAAAACAAGVRYFGFSGHSHTPIPMDEGEVLPADMTEYRQTALRLRAEYAGRMEVLLGLEVDSCADVTPDGFDYWIGSVHYLPDRASGVYDPVDWDERTFRKSCEDGFGGDFLAMAERYYADVAAMAARRPTILGHLDLITKFNDADAAFDESSPRYRRAALGALHAADPAATLLEINTGAMARGYRSAPYPARFLLEEWRAMGGQILLSADAHSADTVIFGYEAAARQARSAGFRECVLLTKEGRLRCPL